MKILKLVHFFRLRSFARNCARLHRIARVVRTCFCGKKTTNQRFCATKAIWSIRWVHQSSILLANFTSHGKKGLILIGWIWGPINRAGALVDYCAVWIGTTFDTHVLKRHKFIGQSGVSKHLRNMEHMLLVGLPGKFLWKQYETIGTGNMIIQLHVEAVHRWLPIIGYPFRARLQFPCNLPPPKNTLKVDISLG